MEKYGISFKEMNKKQKVKHIWTYYRYHILASIIALIVVGSLGKSIFFPKPANLVEVIISGPLYLNDEQYTVSDKFESDYRIGLSVTSLNWESGDQMVTAMYQKIPALLTAKSLDILALPVSQYEEFTKIHGENMFVPLENVPELSKVLEEQADNLFTYDKGIDEEGNTIDAQEHIYGIKVQSFPTISCIDYNEEMVIGLTSTMKDRERSIKVFEYLLGDEAALDHFLDTENEEPSSN